MDVGRKTWTDERLDDFRQSVDHRFDEVNQRMDAGFGRVDGELRALNGRIDGLQRTMVQIGAGMIIAQTGLMATILGLVFTKL